MVLRSLPFKLINQRRAIHGLDDVKERDRVFCLVRLKLPNQVQCGIWGKRLSKFLARVLNAVLSEMTQAERIRVVYRRAADRLCDRDNRDIPRGPASTKSCLGHRLLDSSESFLKSRHDPLSHALYVP